MSIRRAPRPAAHYTVVSNAVLEDGRLSFKAAGMLVYLLSKPDHWEVSREHLASTHTDGLDAVRSGLRELRDAGYVTDDVRRDDAGRIIDKGLVVHDTPQDQPCGGKPTSKGSTQVADPALVSTEVQQGLTEGITENDRAPQPQLQLVVADATPRRSFDDFWQVYPRRVARQAATKAWVAAIKRGVSSHVIVEGARRYASDPNREDQFTAHPATWLNGGRWDDDPLPARGTGQAAGADQLLAMLDRSEGTAIDVGSVLHHGGPDPKGLPR